ncbi:MAG: SDR family NAD(P)-dependent oxidoreductase, partial [Woeseiaceae bacterium]
MTAELENKVVAITGAGKGLGRAYALYLAARGAKVVVNNRSHA